MHETGHCGDVLLVNPGVNKAIADSAFLHEMLGLIYCRGIYAAMYYVIFLGSGRNIPVCATFY